MSAQCLCSCVAQGVRAFAGPWNGNIRGVRGDSQAWRSCGALVVAAFLVRIREVQGARQRCVGQLGSLHGLKEGRRVGESGTQTGDRER